MKYTSFCEMLEKEDIPDNEHIAFVWDDNGIQKRLSFHDFCLEVFAKADIFRKEDSVKKAIIGTSSISQIISFFAAVISGKSAMMIDESASVETIQMMLKYTEFDSVEYQANLYGEDEKKIIEASLCSTKKNTNTKEGDIYFFTSGTTEMSKAAVLTSSSLLASAWNGQQGLPCNKGDIVLSSLPLSHVYGFVCTLLWPLVYKGTIALGRGLRYLSSDPAYFHSTIIPQVTAGIKYLLACNAFNPELKTVLIGGGPCDINTINAVKARGLSVQFGYGLTEASSGIALSEPNKDPLAMKPCIDSNFIIASDGEILVSSPCLMKGYYNNKKATDATIVDGFLHTNDIGYIDKDGMLHVTGRKNDVLVLENGTKIFCPEYEAKISKMLNISDVAVNLKNGVVILFIFSKEALDKAKIGKVIEEFNKTKPLGQYILGYEIRNDPLPRTRLGKIQRYKI